MYRFAYMAASAALLLSVNVTGISHLRQQEDQQPKISRDETVPVMPNFDKPDDAQPQPAPAPTPAGPLSEDNRLQIMRNVDGEFARMVIPLPAGKDGYRVKAGQPVDESSLERAVRGGGAAVNPGDNVQITRLEFREREIVLDINGGGKGHTTNWRDHVQVGLDAPGVPVQTGGSSGTADGGQVPAAPKNGATLILDFGRPLPNMSPDELKKQLATILDFSKQRSAALLWQDTLPPQIQQAIAEKRADVGMDRDEVLAAMGRPERKVRERSEDGTDTEDWIYGHPPAKTVFVRFAGDKVIQVDKYPE